VGYELAELVRIPRFSEVLRLLLRVLKRPLSHFELARKEFHTMRVARFTLAVLIACSLIPPASAEVIQYTAVLSGPAEAPPNESPGVGSAMVTVDLDAGTMHVEANFSGLVGNVTSAHIHCCTAEPNALTAGVATTTPTFPGFPAGVTAGTYDMTFDLTQATSYNAAFVTANGDVTGAMNALLAGLDGERAYFNIHSTEYGGGEIRGFLHVVPEPSAGLLLVSGLALPAFVRRRRQR
jgi:hypothetical protein